MTKPRARVLYIDDDPGLCRLVQKDLQRQGYVVEIATDGISGFDRIAKGGIDVVALDHYMPNQDGLETLASIRALAEPPPVIYVTALQEGRVAVAALKDGAVDYVAKDVHGEFLVLLQRAIDAAFGAVTLRHAKEAAEADNERNRQLTQNIVDTIRDPLVVLEADMKIVTTNKAFLTIFGITAIEAQGRRIAELGQHQWDVPELRALMARVLPDNKPIERFEIEDTFRGLGRRVFNLNARKITQPGNHSHCMLLVFEDITDAKQRERDAAMLTNEISHRIKNSLQIIIGLIAFEARSAAQPYVQGYRAMQTRIGAIAQLYDLISKSSSDQTVAMDAYLKEIAKTITESLLATTSGIKIKIKAGTLEIDPDRAVPFGLLVNELVTNAIKHAFPDGTGCIVLSAQKVADEVELIVADDGRGMAENRPVEISEKRGSNYIAVFVRQLRGVIVPPDSKEPGTKVTIRFPLDIVAPKIAERAVA